MTIARERLRQFAVSQNWARPVLKGIGNARCRAWDVIHGVDTCGEIPLVDLNFESEFKTPGLEYQSHHPSIIRAGLRSLQIRHQNYTFVDFGCGKGRVLLVASEFPFRRIIGLEFAPPLVEIARRNLKKYRTSHQQCLEIEVITADATTYELPPEAHVLYFYSPFAPSTMDRVLQNIESSVQTFPRDVLVLFSGIFSMRDRAFGARREYELLHRGRYFDLYRHRPQ